MISFERKEVIKSEERQIITGMIVSDDFLKQIIVLYDKNYFVLNYAKDVAEWCVEYFNKYKKAPFKEIKAIFLSKKKEIFDDDRLEQIEKFLESISDDYSNYNFDYNIDKAINYFKNASLNELIERIKSFQLIEDYAGAESEIAKFKRVEKNEHAGIDVFNDIDASIQAIRKINDDEYLFKFPGALGELSRPFRRKDFIAIVGPAKRSKTWWLLELAILSTVNRLNTVFFSFETPRDDLLLRIHQRMTGDPLSNIDEKMKIELPYFHEMWDQNKTILKRSVYKMPITAKKVLNRFKNANIMAKGAKFELICAPSNSMSVADVEAHLDNLEYYDGFQADVVIIDYADITRPTRYGDKRHELDNIWLGYRAISQKRNCLVATVSHTAKATLERDIKASDLSEDNRKLNHVTWLAGINQTESEKDLGLIRMSILADRNGRFNAANECHILHNLDIGQVHLDSRLHKREYKN